MKLTTILINGDDADKLEDILYRSLMKRFVLFTKKEDIDPVSVIKSYLPAEEIIQIVKNEPVEDHSMPISVALEGAPEGRYDIYPSVYSLEHIAEKVTAMVIRGDKTRRLNLS